MLTVKPSQWLDTTDPNVIRILRFTLGVTLSVATSFLIAWPLFFVTPIFVAKFLGSPAPCPDFRAGLVVTMVIGIGCGVGLALTYFTINYPIVCILSVAIMMFHIFYANMRGVSPLIVAFLLIGITAIPLVGMESFSLATSIAGGLMLCGGLAFVFVWIAHGLIPDRVSAMGATAAPAAHPPMSDREQIRSAAISTLVVIPVVLVFFTVKMTDMLLVMVFIAMLAQQPDVKTGAKGSMGLIIGNTAGGIAAIVFYNLLVAVPNFIFLILLMLLFGLVFGERILSGKPMAALYATAFSTVILLVGSTTGDFGGDAGSKFYTRIVQIILAGAYIVGAFYLLVILSRQKQKHKTYEQSRVVDDMDVV
jgi:hypothetical protein